MGSIRWNQQATVIVGTDDSSRCNKQMSGEMVMAENSGGIGVLGVLVGALIVVVVGTGLLFATGTIGSNTSTVKLELPKVTAK